MWWNYTYFFASLGAAALILFLWDFLEKEKIEKWMTYAILPTGGLLALISLFSLIATPETFPAIIFIFNFSIIIAGVIFFGVLIRSILLESRAAKLILLSVIILFTSAIIKVIVGLVASIEPTWVNNLLYFGLATQGMLLSVALADRMNQQKLESELKRVEAVEKSQSSTDLAFTDELTGLRNRRFIEKVSPQMIEDIHEGKGGFSLMICGVDGLAEVNQNHGRDMGDEAIKAVGEVLKNALPGEDCIARYRGSEFVILLEGSNESIALGFGKQLKEMIKDIKLPEEISESNLTFSIGISPAVKQDKHVDEVIKRAEMGLFAAKQAGGNQVMGIEALSTLMGRNLLPHDEEAVEEQTSQAEQTLPAGLEHTAAAKKIEAEKSDKSDDEAETKETPPSKENPPEENTDDDKESEDPDEEKPSEEKPA
jgi:diguanylate cyclase (GGDEF)-like protein